MHSLQDSNFDVLIIHDQEEEFVALCVHTLDSNIEILIIHSNIDILIIHAQEEALYVCTLILDSNIGIDIP